MGKKKKRKDDQGELVLADDNWDSCVRVGCRIAREGKHTVVSKNKSYKERGMSGKRGESGTGIA